MALLLTSLYLLCFLLLAGMAVFVLLKNPRAPLHQTFALAALALFAWLATLFAFNHQTRPDALLRLGRLNFAAALLVAFAGYRFVCELAGDAGSRSPSLLQPAFWLLWMDILLLGALILFTPAIDRAELVQAQQHVTVFGPLFPLYILHVLAYLLAAIRHAFRAARFAPPRLSHQLQVIGIGMLATTLVAVTTNVLLPYGFHIFAWQDVGVLSTILFLGAVADAVFVHHLFDVRIILRATFVLAGLVALGLELYQLAVSFLAHLLPLGDAAARGYAATVIALVVNAFTQQSVKHRLERILDHLLPHPLPPDQRPHRRKHNK